MFNWKCFKTDDIRYHPISSTKKAVKRKYVLFFGIRWNIVKTFISMLKKGGINFWKKMRKQKVCIFIVSDNAKCTTYIYILYHPNDKLSVVKKTETNWEKSIIKQSSYLAWLPEKKKVVICFIIKIHSGCLMTLFAFPLLILKDTSCYSALKIN